MQAEPSNSRARRRIFIIGLLYFPLLQQLHYSLRFQRVRESEKTRFPTQPVRDYAFLLKQG